MRIFKFGLLLGIFIFLIAAHSQANAITIAGFDFDDNAFADTAGNAAPDITLLNGAPTLTDALTGSDTSTGISYFGAFPGSVDVGFTDNYIVNEAGDDLIIFEFGNVRDSLDVTIGLTTLNSGLSIDTGVNSGFGVFDIHYWAFDLSDFGLASGATVSALTLFNFDADGNGTSATPSVIAALNSAPVPEPATMLLLGIGLAGLAGISRKKFKK